MTIIQPITGITESVSTGSGDSPLAPGATAPLLPGGGNLVEALLLLQLKDFQAQRRSERERQVAERQQQQTQAEKAYDKAREAANMQRRSAWGQAVVSAVCIGVSAGLKFTQTTENKDTPWRAFLQGGADQTPGMLAKVDEGAGFSWRAKEAELAEKRANNRSDAAAKRAADAGDQVDELRRLESKMVDLLDQLQAGEQKNREAAIRA